MRRTNIYLDDDQLATLRRLGLRRGVPVAALVREALDAWLASQGIRVIEQDEWERRFTDLLSRRHSAAMDAGFKEDAVERDVARTVSEVRRTRAAGRR